MPEQYELPGLALTPTGRTKKIKLKPPSEHTEQEMLCSWLSLIQNRYNLRFYAVPNGTPLRTAKGKTNWGYINKLKREGVKPGVPDLVILQDGRALYIEMKRQKGGIRSEEQKEWHSWLMNNNFSSAVCKGFEEAKYIVERWVRSQNCINPLF